MTYQQPPQGGYPPLGQPYGADPYGQQGGYQPQQQRGYQAPAPGHYPYPPQQGGRPPGPPGPPRRRHTTRNVALSLLGILVLIIAIGAALSSGGKQGGSPSAAGSSSAPAAASTTPAAKTAPARPHVIAVFRGSGIENTRQFRTPASWILRYSYNCAADGGSGNFIVTENGAGPVNVNALGRRGHGVTRGYSDAGRHYLEVDSECSWRIRVIS